MKIRKDFKFDAAHNLTKYHGKCEKLHGHTYKLSVILDGTPHASGDDEGMIIDFCEIADIVKSKVIAKLDHTYINDILPQPTAENIAVWIWQQTAESLKRDNCQLCEIHVWETETSCVVLTRDDMNII